jgi:tripartite-type tricarboxylate transporter receptor subunit TctC
MRNKLSGMGFIVSLRTPEQSEQKIKLEVEKWAQVIKANKIQAD